MPLDRHRTIIALVVVGFGLFFLEDIFGVVIADYGNTVPANVRDAASGVVQGGVSLDSLGVMFTVVSALFLHAGVDHVLYNMIYLWAFASLTSQHLGQWWALALFFVTGVCGNILHIVMNLDSPIGLLGASGAVSGFEGVYLGLALRWTLRWPDVWPLAHPIPPAQLCLFAIVGVGFDLYRMFTGGGGVAYLAHLGGFFSGLAIAWLITSFYRTEESWQSRRLRR